MNRLPLRLDGVEVTLPTANIQHRSIECVFNAECLIATLEDRATVTILGIARYNASTSNVPPTPVYG